MNYINKKQPKYDPVAIQPMRDEMTYLGFEEMLAPNEVESQLSSNDGQTKMVFINSVCGCSAGSARPGVALALQHNKIPHKLLTSFAGNDNDALDYIRENYLSEFMPSSPAIAIVENGKTIYHMGRSDIVGKSPEEIATTLISTFDSINTTNGPSVSVDSYKELVHSISCGSKIPLNNN